MLIGRVARVLIEEAESKAGAGYLLRGQRRAGRAAAVQCEGDDGIQAHWTSLAPCIPEGAAGQLLNGGGPIAEERCGVLGRGAGYVQEWRH